MKYSKYLSVLCMGLVFGSGLVLHAQESRVLSLEDFINQVKNFHPVIKQADFMIDRAAAGLLEARGSFDPVIDLSTDQKKFAGTDYYKYSNTSVKFPTVMGFALKGGIERSEGQFKNPERTSGVASYAGIEVPLLKGLLIDKKRAILQKAKIYRQQSEQEKRATINDLLYGGYSSYWDWVGAYRGYRIYTDYLALADERLRLVRIGWNNGDKSVADTIEAFTQLQNYRLLQADALTKLNAAMLDLAQFLWLDGEDPYLLPEYVRPDTVQFVRSYPLPDTTGIFALLRSGHPSLQSMELKLRSLEVERRLARQDLLPAVDVSANLLSKEYFMVDNFSGYYLENNYKLGVSVSIPLLFRQGRGAVRNAKINIQDANLDLQLKAWQLDNKIRQYYNEAEQLGKQLDAVAIAHENYRTLLNMEKIRFAQGESSLFLVNSRESKTVEMEQKLVELLTKYIKANYAVRWAAAIL